VFAGLTVPDPPLSDGIVSLRLPDATRDSASLAVINADPEIIRWSLGAPPPAADPATVFAAQLERWERATDAIFSIEAEGHDERGHGYATRTVRLLARWVFNDLEIGRLQARTSLGNAASERVLERAGFQREGIARAGYVLPQTRVRVDCQTWSLLPGELR
jgi:hypothetical protein